MIPLLELNLLEEKIKMDVFQVPVIFGALPNNNVSTSGKMLNVKPN